MSVYRDRQRARLLNAVTIKAAVKTSTLAFQKYRSFSSCRRGVVLVFLPCA